MTIVDYGKEGDEFLSLTVIDLKKLIPDTGKRIAYIKKVKDFNEVKEKLHLKENENMSKQRNFRIDTLNQLVESDADVLSSDSPCETNRQRILNSFTSLLIIFLPIFFLSLYYFNIFRT